MFPTASNLRLFFVFFLLIFDFCCAYPSPFYRTSTVFPRREETRLTSPVTITTTEKITTDIGTFIQTCTITLTPIDGTDNVREDKSCVVTPDVSNSSALPPPATSTSSSDSLSSTSDITSSSSTSVLSSTAPPDSSVTSLPPSSSGSAPPVDSVTLTSVSRPDATSLGPSSSSGTGDGGSSVPTPVATPPPDSTDSSTVTSPPSSPTPPSLPQSSSPSSPAVSPTASAENAGAAAPFDPPGKKLEVLPIGLGVFAGVSVIALLVVGIVTYERTKHRRNFRRRRQEEANNQLGYGSM